MYRVLIRMAVVVVLSMAASGCGGGSGGSGSGGGHQSTTAVQVSWSENHEAAVNAPGGGYRVYYGGTSGFTIAGASFVDVPFVSAPKAPTTAKLVLTAGVHFIKVVAYSALNPSGSAPSDEVPIFVPLIPTAASNE